ncbi:MAG: DUF5345 family protein [Firmicutes bacterium]|nr:DUF5345 family protein [Bacillota bacterium]
MQTERDFNTALHQLKEPLDAFGQEVNEMVAMSPTPPLDYFQRLVTQTRHRVRRRLVLENLLFLLVAFCFLGGVGIVLQKGYLFPIMIVYAGIGLFLPFLNLWSPIAQKREVD